MKVKNNLSINQNGFVFDPVTGESYTLNPTGLEMLSLLQEGKTREEIRLYYLDHYEVDQWVFEKAYLDFTFLLEKNHLLSHE